MVGKNANGHGTTSPPQAGVRERFTRRWRIIGGGLCNVWRFGDLDVPAPTGRLLLRGPNGTGKTTALEVLAPYLLDLNPARLSAGKARTTTLSSLMKEKADGKRRYGYAWLSFAHPQEGVWTFGARIHYSEGASPPVSVIPFAVPARPLHELKLYGHSHASLTADQFEEAVRACGGQIFRDEDAYVAHLAVRLFGTPDSQQLTLLASRLRQVRNPALLGDLSPQAAAAALRESLPGVDEAVIKATSDALAESEETRKAFERDTEAADVLEDFRVVWTAHATEVIGALHDTAVASAADVKKQQSAVKSKTATVKTGESDAARAKERVERLDVEMASAKSEIAALEKDQSWKDAGRLQELKLAAVAQREAAASAGVTMKTAASAAAEAADSLRRELENIAEDLGDLQEQVRRLDAAADDGAALLKWTVRARPTLRAGDVAVDPGGEILLQTDVPRLRAAAALWRAQATKRKQAAESAGLAVIDHQPVQVLREIVTSRADEARAAASAAEKEAARARAAELLASAAGKDLLAKVVDWIMTRGDFAAELPDVAWSRDEAEQLGTAEPAQVLAASDAWAGDAHARSETIAARLRSRASEAGSVALKQRAEANAHRDEAKKLRDGELLPFPRPEWAGAGNDDVAFGAALDWSPGFDDAGDRAKIESALTASGILGATLDLTGARTPAWAVEPIGPIRESNLGEVITVDESHPLAGHAKAVLARIGLSSTAGVEREHAGLEIGRDGSFGAGVLRGNAAQVDGDVSVPVASFVGARQRREAALARAQTLEETALQLESEASNGEKLAEELKRRAQTLVDDAQSFPDRAHLRAAEARRAELVTIAAESRSEAMRTDAVLVAATHQHQRSYSEWAARTRARELPTDLSALIGIRDTGQHVGDQLEKAAAAVAGKHAERVERAIAGYSAPATGERLSQVQATAQSAHAVAASSETKVKVLEETAGEPIAKILARHTAASTRLTGLSNESGPARDDQLRSEKALATARAELQGAQQKLLEELEPQALHAVTSLREMLAEPGVLDAVLGGKVPAADAGILGEVETALKGRKTFTRRTLLDRYDAARTKLAGLWSIDPGDPRGELLTFSLTYRDTVYSPIHAAVYANGLKQRAQKALAASEEKALREFVIGRLPAAISTAWTRLKDWEHEVNRKMRSASASSGLSVQVRLPLNAALSPAHQEVYELCCKVSDAERTVEQERLLGQRLQALIAAAQVQNSTMIDRVAAAVDIRDWVDVNYEIDRGDGKMQRLGPRTGLSTGERRLVFLAPMLAAVAASYDKFGPSALRLVALDEVPAEVDERGKEGLARFIAELDLDVICTSHLWDGCPGAWDGIDAYDLEAGGDGTVVAFPMLIRGVSQIPELPASG